MNIHKLTSITLISNTFIEVRATIEHHCEVVESCLVSCVLLILLLVSGKLEMPKEKEKRKEKDIHCNSWTLVGAFAFDVHLKLMFFFFHLRFCL